MSGEKYTAEEWLNHLESTDDGYLHYSQVLPVMQAYADQQSAALKASLAELIPIAEQYMRTPTISTNDSYSRHGYKAVIEHAKKLLDIQ